MAASYTNNLNGLIILTTMTFGIAQYFENKQRDTIRNIKLKVQDYKFKVVGNNKFLQKAKIRWEIICNEDPLSTHEHIVLFMLLLMSYAVAHIALLLNYNGVWLQGGLVLLAAVLLVTIGHMAGRLHFMRKQLKQISHNVKELSIHYEAWKAACAEFDDDEEGTT